MKQLIEAIIFTAEQPVSLERIIKAVQVEYPNQKNIIKKTIEELQQDYSDRGVELIETKKGFRFQSKREYAAVLQQLHRQERPKFSKAFLETLALIAFRQPITRAEIEEIRGVSVNTQFLQTMLDRDWIEISGYKNVPGKPVLYVTTDDFLSYFGVAHLDELKADFSLDKMKNS